MNKSEKERLYNLEVELEETKEALSRSRALRKSLTSEFDPSGAPSLEERARRLFVECYRVPEDYQFESEEEKEFWMQKFVSLNS